jgi:ribosome-associated protein
MENEIQDKSKTQAKKEADALQNLGEELIKLPRHRLNRMGLPEKLLKALIDSQAITSHIAGRRQRQFIGSLMRDVDPEPIRQALLQVHDAPPVESEIIKEARMWRDRLLTGDPAVLEDFIRACPGLERQRLKQLIRNAQKENARKEKAGKSSKSLKALERIIMEGLGE